eukprot:TRINITY_DN10022_c0_g1_i1.p1 TRINITY_DN10022_c0_g1~~TRINITY_DN10022_c0_g1_i1.p1  ORF type:complete len:234 (+),score=29.30 TRINITY_DN10022_c0_g1_i1:48-704(+)
MGWLSFGKKKEPLKKFLDEEVGESEEQKKKKKRRARKFHYGECVVVKNTTSKKWRRGIVVAFEDTGKEEKRILGKRGKGKPIVVLTGTPNDDTTWRIYDELKHDPRQPSRELLLANGILLTDVHEEEQQTHVRSTNFCRAITTKPAQKPGYHANLFSKAIRERCPRDKGMTELDKTIEKLLSRAAASSSGNDFVESWTAANKTRSKSGRRAATRGSSI